MYIYMICGIVKTGFVMIRTYVINFIYSNKIHLYRLKNGINEGCKCTVGRQNDQHSQEQEDYDDGHDPPFFMLLQKNQIFTNDLKLRHAVS